MRTSLEYLPQLFQLHNTLTRTKCTSEKELIYTHGALRCLRGIVGLDLPSYQGEPAGRHPPTAVISRTDRGMARTCGGRAIPRACGRGRRREEKAASFLCYFGSGGGVHFNAIAEEKHAEDGGREGGAWQLATELRPKRAEEGEEN